MASHPDTGPRPSGLTRLLVLGGVLWLTALLTVCGVQITLDGSLGPGGPLTGPHYRIGAELGQLRGGNLFHSFGAFNVPAGGSATFTGSSTITHILSRVTGGQPSAIDGLLRSEIAGANLFLLNPSGVLFGPNARLDVSGSFHASTADVLRFADGAPFSAHLGQASVLTMAVPAAFAFLSTTPGAITIQGSALRVNPERALSVVGGDITLVGGRLEAPSGRMQLASVASPGEVGFNPLELAPDLQVTGFARLGQLALAQGAFVNASGNGGGTVLLRSGRLRVDGAFMFADNTGSVNGTGLGMDLQIAADAVMTKEAFITTDSFGAGRARDLRLTEGSLHMDNAVVGSRPSASGDGGNVTLKVGTLTLTGGAQIDSGTFSGSSGNAGNLEVQAGQLMLTGGAQIGAITRGSGRGGELTVMATDTLAISGRDSQGTLSGLFIDAEASGDAGRLSIATPRLTMDAGLIQAVPRRAAAAVRAISTCGWAICRLPGARSQQQHFRAWARRGGDRGGERGDRHQRAGPLRLERAVQWHLGPWAGRECAACGPTHPAPRRGHRLGQQHG